MHKDFPGISREFLVEKKVVHFLPGAAIEVLMETLEIVQGISSDFLGFPVQKKESSLFSRN